MLTGWMSAESSLWGAPFQCVLTRSFLGDSAGGKSEGDGGRGRKSDLLVSLFFFFFFAAAAAKSLQLCPTLSDPIDGSPPGSPVPGILQARTLEWVAISFSNVGK